MSYKLKIKKIGRLLLVLVSGLAVGSWLFFTTNNCISAYKYRKELKQELIFWKKIAGKYDNYPDVWAKLAVNWYNLEEQELAQLAIEKARKLDPIREEIKNLEKEIIF